MRFNSNCPCCRTCLDADADANKPKPREDPRALLNDILQNVDIGDNITMSDIEFDDNEADVLYFEPVRSRLAERRTTQSTRQCGICGRSGHCRRNCIFRDAFM